MQTAVDLADCVKFAIDKKADSGASIDMLLDADAYIAARTDEPLEDMQMRLSESLTTNALAQKHVDDMRGNKCLM